ncbi:MAG: hypothetical protein KG003_03245 [Bacteroidetes bacterium]|nr:hypothetical protein [Bacteroidota bacterium]
MLKHLFTLFLALGLICQVSYSNPGAFIIGKNSKKENIHSEKSKLVLGQLDPAENEELDEDNLIPFIGFIACHLTKSSNFSCIFYASLKSFDNNSLATFNQLKREFICVYNI